MDFFVQETIVKKGSSTTLVEINHNVSTLFVTHVICSHLQLSLGIFTTI